MIEYPVKLGGGVDGISFLGDVLLLHGRYTTNYGPGYDDLNGLNRLQTENRNDVRRTLYTFRLGDSSPRIRRALTWDDDEQPPAKYEVVRQLNDHVYRSDVASSAGKYMTLPMPNVRIPAATDLQLRRVSSEGFAWFALSPVSPPNPAFVILGEYGAVHLRRTSEGIMSTGTTPALRNVILMSGKSDLDSRTCVKLCRDGFLYVAKSHPDMNLCQLWSFTRTTQRRDFDYWFYYLPLPDASIITDFDVTADGKLCAIAHYHRPNPDGLALRQVSLFEVRRDPGQQRYSVSLLVTLAHPADLLAFSPDGLTLAMSIPSDPFRTKDGTHVITGIRVIDIDR